MLKLQERCFFKTGASTRLLKLITELVREIYHFTILGFLMIALKKSLVLKLVKPKKDFFVEFHGK